ncbi:uncharacterized protein HD556DRAFT_1441438 [Suillus plorans]|uniref:Uncharacterized protein n=1 Tax=Suillus plorans TaxID=116603 RepID=A0A9P7AWL1_9AGAM|nr:uncharacterized protein HD556DRAFT_1441438 [Suillus plorans]KAG1796739.1 hypothetical protein HD556DRAFT_1441438 [Suillus plorans]
MTQNSHSSSQLDTMVSVRLDGLIEFLRCLSLEDRDTLSRGLGIDAPDGTTETPLPVPPVVSGNSPAVTVTSMEVPIPAPSTPTMAAPTVPTSPAPTAAAPTGPTTILVEFDEYNGSDDEDVAAAAAALADDSLLHFYCGTYFNVPAADAEPPFYCISRGRHIGVFSGWDATGPKVLGVSHGIFHKVDSIEKGMSIMRSAIDRGDAMQVL